MYKCDRPKTKQFLEEELFQTKKDIRRLQEEITALRSKEIDLRQLLCSERNKNKMSKRKFDDTIKCNELEKRSILTKQEELLSKIHVLEETVECMNKRVQEVIAENTCWKSKYNNLKEVNKRMENSKRSSENTVQEVEQDLLKAQARVKSLEEEKRAMANDVFGAKNEIQSMKQKLSFVMNEKENMQKVLDCKNLELRKLGNENSKKYHVINQFEEKLSRLNCELVRSNNDGSRAQKEICRLKGELGNSLEEKSKYLLENRKLETALECLNKDIEFKQTELQKASNDMVKMKNKILCFSEKFHKMEQLLETKDRERRDEAHKMSVLEAQIMNIESKMKLLDEEKGTTCNNLRLAHENIKDLQITIKNKDSFICAMEGQIKEFSRIIQLLKNDLSKYQQKNMLLKNEVETGKEVLNNMELQKNQYEAKLQTMNSKLEYVNNDICKSKLIIKDLTNQLDIQKQTIVCLEEAVSESHKEAREESIQNLSVNRKVQEIQTTVDKLQDKLYSVNNALSNCQTACIEVKSQNNELEFQLTNERYANVLSGECSSLEHQATYSSRIEKPLNDQSRSCACKSPEEYLKEKYGKKKNDNKNEITKYNYGKGHFSVAVTNCFDDSQTSNFTALDNTKPHISRNDSDSKESLSNIIVQNNKQNLTNRIYENSSILSDFSRNAFECLNKDFNDCFNPNNKYVLKSILKQAAFSSSNSSEAITAISNSHARGIKPCPVKNYSNTSFNTETTDDSSIKLLSIIEEGPTYRLEKKCYKKICGSTDEDQKE